jgi:hypothetical protein
MHEQEGRHHGDCGCEGGRRHEHHGHGDCQPGGPKGFGTGPGSDGQGCCGMGHGADMPFVRRFQTKEERIARLEQYLKDLQAEAKGVEERIAKMKATA